MLASLTDAMNDKCIYTFYLFSFEFSSINLVIDSRRANIIIDMIVFIATLEICNCFSGKKVGFLYCLINRKTNI